MAALKKCLFIFGGIIGVFSLAIFCKKQTAGFTLRTIYSSESTPYPYEELSPLPSAQLEKILNQPFYYLGKGAQAFAFVSQDNHYVIKFFRHKHPSHLLQPIYFLLPSAIKSRLEGRVKKRKLKLYKDFFSYTLAYQMLPQETGLLYLHLRKTDHLHQTVTLYDKIGVKHQVYLDEVEFIIQQKAEHIYPTLTKWIEEGELMRAKKSLTQLIALFKKRCELGIFDKDPDLQTNLGFVGDTPIQFDIGRFKLDPAESDPKIYVDELIRITDFLCKWLDTRCPELSTHVRTEIYSLKGICSE